MIHRGRPDLSRPAMALKATALATSERSPTANRFRCAYEMLDVLAASMEHIPFNSDLQEKPISEICRSSAMLQGCATIIHAMTLTGFRVALVSELMVKPPMPSVWSHITLMQPPPSEEINLVGVHSREYVVLLAAAIRLFMMGHPLSHVLRIVYELSAQEAHGALDDFESAIDVESGGQLIDKVSVQFALASLGVRVARKLFRKPEEQRSQIPGHARLEPALSTPALLDAIEWFAKRQVELQPERSVGYWNRGWVAQQSAAVRDSNGLACAASCLRFMTKCYELADAESDDFYSSTARIEAAMCTVLGGSGVVGYKVCQPPQPGQVGRDMVLEQPPAGATSKLRIMGATDEITSALSANETRRLSEGVHPAVLERGERVLIPWWEVLELWNAAVPPFDALARWQHEHNVYGEASGWHIVTDFLEHTMSKQRLAPGQYALPPVGGAGFVGRHDHGHGNELRGSNMGSLREALESENAARAALNPAAPTTPRVKPLKVKPNEPCSCGSGKKYKKCCGKN